MHLAPRSPTATGSGWARSCALSSRRLGAFAGQLKAFRGAVGRHARHDARRSHAICQSTTARRASFADRPARIGTEVAVAGCAVRLEAAFEQSHDLIDMSP